MTFQNGHLVQVIIQLQLTSTGKLKLSNEKTKNKILLKSSVQHGTNEVPSKLSLKFFIFKRFRFGFGGRDDLKWRDPKYPGAGTYELKSSVSFHNLFKFELVQKS